VDVDWVPGSDPPSSPARSGPVTAALALGAADAATRMGVRRHPVVPAAILSDFVVRAIEIAAAINRGRHGNLDRPLIRTLARDLGWDLDRAREYALARHLKLGVTVTRRSVLVLALDLTRERYLDLALIRHFNAAVHLARELGHAIDGTLGRHLDLRLSFSRDDDLELAGELADGLDSDLDRVHSLAHALAHELGKTRERILNVNQAREQILNIDRALSHALDLAFERSRALDRVCALGVTGRLGISPTDGLAEALLDGALDDFTSADLTHTSLADADLTGVRWSLSETMWPTGTDVKALLARSEEVEPGGVLVVTRRGMVSPFAGQASVL
jgi:hypothetical protein